ncbi:hypothetical protein EVAR_12887_1 [Eumeta japonica]|uniref:Uncharacterized protein n=1 Tax=Eumeta variegata TaxID=151549 RepID=A0A4C1TW17_EUMVA|nr:hypothetical protein EVAR_12887_1 [Eumeta japonica]
MNQLSAERRERHPPTATARDELLSAAGAPPAGGRRGRPAIVEPLRGRPDPGPGAVGGRNFFSSSRRPTLGWFTSGAALHAKCSLPYNPLQVRLVFEMTKSFVKYKCNRDRRQSLQQCRPSFSERLVEPAGAVPRGAIRHRCRSVMHPLPSHGYGRKKDFIVFSHAKSLATPPTGACCFYTMRYSSRVL